MPFVPLTDPRWAAALADPLGVGAGPAFDPPLEARLAAHLQYLAAPVAADNHARLAAGAENELEKLPTGDMRHDTAQRLWTVAERPPTTTSAAVTSRPPSRPCGRLSRTC